MSKLIDKIVNKTIVVLSRYKDNEERKSYIQGIRQSYSRLSSKKKLSEEQRKEIELYYQDLLGYKVPTDWHQYFYSRTGLFSKYYMPTSVYKTDLIGRLNVYPLKRAYTDKNITDLILPNVHQPKVFLKNMNGYYYIDGNAVPKETACELCKDLGEVIIKPSLTGRGVGVKKINITNGQTDYEGKTLTDVFKEYKSDFLIEELIHQHPDMAALNPSSINTIRIVTYRNGMDVHVVYTVIRIGRKNQSVDNESAGGISTIVHADGTLGRYAYGAPGIDKIEYTDSGIRLDGYKIPSFQQAIDGVKSYHYHLPYFKVVGWDIAIEEDGTPIMIEFNMTPDLSQSANGPAFGEYTEMMVHDAMSHNNTWSKAAMTSMWKRNTQIR